MSSYGELQQAILDDTHRPDLASLVPRFIRQGEQMINRRLIAYVLTDDIPLLSGPGIEDGIYTLPVGFLQMRAIHATGPDGDLVPLVAVIPSSIYRLDVTASPSEYCLRGDGTAQVRGVPADTSLPVTYYGKPDYLDSTDLDDTNALLDDHESLYQSAAQFFLYKHTQDRELASDELDIFISIMDDLNDQVSRQLGGNRVSNAYNMNSEASY